MEAGQGVVITKLERETEEGESARREGDGESIDCQFDASIDASMRKIATRTLRSSSQGSCPSVRRRQYRRTYQRRRVPASPRLARALSFPQRRCTRLFLFIDFELRDNSSRESDQARKG